MALDVAPYVDPSGSTRGDLANISCPDCGGVLVFGWKNTPWLQRFVQMLDAVHVCRLGLGSEVELARSLADEPV